MEIRDNSGKLMGEINNIVGPDGSRITTNTIYSSTGRVLSQNITSRDNAGNVKTETVYGGKVLP